MLVCELQICVRPSATLCLDTWKSVDVRYEVNSIAQKETVEWDKEWWSAAAKEWAG